MVVLVSVGDALVPEEELREKMSLGTTSRFLEAAAKGGSAEMGFSGGSFTPESIDGRHVLGPPAEVTAAIPDHRPIGLGKPLTVEILTVYPGDAPGRFPFGRSDLLVVSGMKSIQTHEAQARALNQLIPEVEDQVPYGSSAFRQGSPIVFYSPAMTDSSSVFDLELIVDSFDEELGHRIAKLLGVAGGLPVFAATGGSAGVILMAASQLVKLGSSLAEALIDGDPYLACSHEIRFDTAGLPEATARILVLANYRDQDEFRHYKAGLAEAGSENWRVVLKHRGTNEVYDGDAPYVIVSLDGRKRPELDGFSAKALSAAMLQQFYGGNDLGGQVVTSIEKGLEFYNDFKFRRQALGLKAEIAGMPEGEDKEREKKRLKACIANIRNKEFHPPE